MNVTCSTKNCAGVVIYITAQQCKVCYDRTHRAERYALPGIAEKYRKSNNLRRKSLSIEERRNRDLARTLRTYNLTLKQFGTQRDVQKGLCALCGKEPTRPRLDIDHDHRCCPRVGSCGKCLRGLLCDHCNRGLGCFKDDILLLTRAIAYLGSDGIWQGLDSLSLA